MPFLAVFGIGLAVIMALMTLLWLVSLYLKNSSIVDAFWGTGFVIAGWLYAWLSPEGSPERRLLIVGVVTVWGLRLSLYILRRNWRKPEDYRYQAWRHEAGPSWWWRSYLKVFVLQGMLLWLISAPLLAAMRGEHGLGLLDGLGAVVWAAGFFFEAAGDAQLAAFKANPANKGKVMTGGVWRYTRHPNYFGDAAQWWGFYLIAAAEGGWWAVFSPLLMTFLLVKVSGAALLEKSMLARPGYAEYARRTSGFFPWFPRG